MIGPYVSLSAGMAPGQEMVSDPVVSIGDRTLIGRGSHIVGHFCVEIGDDIQTGPYVYITDQNHVYRDPDVPIGAQWPVESSVSIGSGSWLGTGVVVLPGSRIGRNVAVGAGSVVTGDLPDHCVAVGSPAKVVKRYSPRRRVARHRRGRRRSPWRNRAQLDRAAVGSEAGGKQRAHGPEEEEEHHQRYGATHGVDEPALRPAPPPAGLRRTRWR